MTFLQGGLADREKWSAVGECAIEKTMAVLGTKSAMLILREAYYGTTRFDDFARRVGITNAAASARLAELVDLWAMFEWGRQHPPGHNRLRLIHLDCGAEATVEIRCTEGHLVPPDELGMRLKR
jgi:hypothetical protein